MINYSPFEVNDFSGGITDNYIDGQPNKARFLDNFLITNNKRLFARPGSSFFDDANPQVPSGQQRISALINLDPETLLFNALRRVYYLDGGSFNSLTGPTGNDVLTDGNSSNNTSFAYWNDHIIITNDALSKPMKIYKDSGSNLQVRNAGLPALASDPSVVIGTAGTFNYIYAFAYYYEYTAGQLQFVDIGPTKEISVTLSENPGTSSNTINGIPTIVNGATDNFDTANIKVKIYRTVADGDVLYEIGEVNNGVTSFIDNNDDADIQTNLTIYTNGDVLDNDEPPRCKYVHVTNSIGIYGHIQEGNNILKNRVLMSARGDIDSVPAGNIIDVDDEIVGVNSFEHIPLVFCRRHIYRIDGFYDDFGGGDPLHQRINDTVGCLSNNSVVQTPYGTFFAGNDGFYWTDAYKVMKISNELNERYKSIAENSDRVYGTYDELENRVYWCVKKDPTSLDLDSFWVLDLRFGVRPDATFTTWSGGNSFSPTAITFFNRELVRGDSRGYVFKHNENILTDRIVDTLSLPSTWEEQTVIWDYTSCAYPFGTTFMRKWVTRINLTCQNETNLSLAIESINDDGRKLGELRPIRFRGNLTWGDEDAVWGDDSIIWNYDGFIDEFRRFPAGGLRCNYKQVRFTNAFIITHNSDTYGIATVNGSTKTANLVDDFPTSAVGYQIFFESDNYSRGYEILTISGNELTFLDDDDQSPSGNYKWVIKGYPKGEVFKLISYCLHYGIIGKTQLGYRSSGDGSNG